MSSIIANEILRDIKYAMLETNKLLRVLISLNSNLHTISSQDDAMVEMERKEQTRRYVENDASGWVKDFIQGETK